jgi:hypothetical protein
MRKLDSWVVLSIGLAGIALAILINTSPAVGAPTASTTQVVVTNTPLPVSGTVSLGGTATVRLAAAPPVAQLLSNFGGYPDTWTNSSGFAAVIELVNGQTLGGDPIQLSVSYGGGSFESHSYILPTAADPKGNFYAHALTKIPVPAGATVTVSGGASVELTGHLE